MKLNKLLKGFKYLNINADLNMDILHLSQKVENCKNGSLFFCFKGVNFDGHNYLNEVKNKGAKVVICERFVKDCSLPQIVVKNVRQIILKVCNNFYQNILKNFKFLGVTGTNGKTTCTYILKSVLETSGKKVGVIGTNGVKIGNKNLDSSFTTPDTVTLFEIFNEMKKNDVEFIVMEVSAHAIDLLKVKGIKFEVGIFTNLTQDHLDYFKSMYNYALCKMKFLNKIYCKNVVINTDDKYGKLFYKLSNSNIFNYGIEEPSSNFAMDLNLKEDKSNFLINVFDEVLEIDTNLICKFNVYNILSCCVALKILKIDNDFIVEGIKRIKNIDGRLNCYKLKNGAIAIIDFAHTPDGLEKVLENLNNLRSKGKIITVFGCGGNRDKDKRHKMGKIAELLSDEVVVTNDNPRWEDEKEIVRDILVDIKKNVNVEFNREKAIEQAIENSKSGDVILIAGKGSENYQEIKGIKHPYNDKDVVLKYC